jgi:hypothetical protein
MHHFTIIVCCFLLLSACAPGEQPALSLSSPAPSNESYAPKSGDHALMRSKFFLDKNGTSIVKLETQPAQFTVSLKGSLPTPCNQPRIVINPPNSENKIVLEVYSVIDPQRMCEQMIKPFEAKIALGGFPAGHYSVWVNEVEIGEIDA